MQGNFPERVALVYLLRLNEREPDHDVEAVFCGFDAGAIFIDQAFGTAEALLNKRDSER